MLADGYPEVNAIERLRADPTSRSMRDVDRAFITANGSALGYYASRWVPDPMHNWSRPWEYLYAYERIGAAAGALGSPELRILDAGSGLTFFPHFLVNRHPGFRVDCVDADPRLADDATRLAPPASPLVTYTAGDLQALEVDAASYDVVACVSVLEHLDEPARAIAGFRRALRPGGRLVLTIDVSLDGDTEIPLAGAKALVAALEQTLRPLGSPLAGLETFDSARHLTTETARAIDPTLLPWAPPRFHRVTCFGMTFLRSE